MDRNLQAFLAVAQTENLTRACDLLNLTQSSITKRIANLEDEYRTALFERHRRGMRLTEAGRLFLGHAKRIDAEYRHGKEKISAIGAAGMSVLRVGAGPLFHLRYVAPLFAKLNQIFPELILELLSDSNIRTIPMLIEGRLDVVLGIIEPENLDDAIFTKRVTHVEHGVVFRADDRLAMQQRVELASLNDKKWLIYADDPDLERTIESHYLPGTAQIPKILVRTTSFTTGLQLVAQGGFAMSAPIQLAPIIEAHGLVIRPTATRMPKREAGIHVRKSALEFGAIKTILTSFKEI